MVKERPILFNGDMVRAILDGRKTQTRRPIKPQPPEGARMISACDMWGWELDGGFVGESSSPFGGVGTHLYVRETWRIVGWHEGMPLLLEYKSDGKRIEEPGDSTYWDEDKYMQYYFDCTDDCLAAGFTANEEGVFNMPDDEIPTRWRPSIHMPKWASRITLEVERVWVEQVHEMSDLDFRAEGVEPVMRDTGGFTPWGEGIDMPDYWQGFANAWDSIYAKRGFGWDSNPWAFACEFKVLEVTK